MIIAIDTETKGLNTKNFLLGTIITEKNKMYNFNDKTKMYNKILELGQKENKRKRNLYVYAHNMQYDYYTIVNIKDPKLTIKSYYPFIATKQNEQNKSYIYFLDTMGLYKRTLKNLGDTINITKKETPIKLLNEQKENLTFQELNQIQKYCNQDTRIVIEFIKQLKTKLKEENIKIRKLITTGQIAINYLITEIKKNNKIKDQIIENQIYSKFYETKNKEELHKAYRGGRIETFKLGKYNETNYIDVNSLYPYAATKIDFPALNTEVKIENPETIMTQKEIINKLGISTVIINKKEEEIGQIPIRTKKEIIFPKQKCKIYGTYTNYELKKFQEEGHQIEKIEKTILYEKTEENPLNKIMKKLYEKRIKNNNKFNKYFYKMLMNSMIGKLGQRKNNFDLKLDEVDKYKEYMKKGYKVKDKISLNYLYIKNYTTEYPKYYAPIIPAYVNAYARQFLYENLKNIGYKNLLYCATDSIMYKKTKNENKIKIGNKLGEWKKTNENEKVHIYGKNLYQIGKIIKLSGITNRNITEEDFKKGKIKHKKMITLKSATNIKEVGTFIEQEVDLTNKIEKEIAKKEDILENKIFIDIKEENNINFLINNI